ncbi:MAG: DUF4238 domain-containing protein [Clostridia bacterium]|nr:DUF4238 domain-containing protein [Clostridia bacterium]
MPTRRQHFVPCVYMKAWETKVETLKEPTKKFDGVYVFCGSNIGEGANRNSVLWKPHLYTIRFQYSYICKSCPKLKQDFVNMIYDYLRNYEKQPIYGKYGYSIIKTKKSIEKHFFELMDWDFYYDDGKMAKKAVIQKQIESMNSYLLESSFDDFFEKNWEKIYNDFISAVHNGIPVGLGRSERIVPEEIASNMLSAFFIMLCRNPCFDAMGIYTNIKNNILYPVFTSMCQDEDEGEGDNSSVCVEGREYADELMTGIWYSELYKMFFKNSEGFYHNAVRTALDGCQMILFEAYSEAGSFITSDNPAFEHKIVIEIRNNNGMIFPISPKYLVFIAKGDEGIDIVDHRFANTDTIRYFNKIIAQHKTNSIISNQKDISCLL